MQQAVFTPEAILQQSLIQILSALSWNNYKSSVL